MSNLCQGGRKQWTVNDATPPPPQKKWIYYYFDLTPDFHVL